MLFPLTLVILGMGITLVLALFTLAETVEEAMYHLFIAWLPQRTLHSDKSLT